MDVAETMQRRYDLRHLWTKLGEDDPLLQMQILIRATSQIPQRAEANVKALETCFRQFSGQNHFRVVGVRLLGVAFVGSDSWFRRWYFDRRFDSGLFRPARRSIVNAREIAALLKPPTKHCRGQNIVRLGGVIPRAPQSLPTFERQRDLLPLGRVNSDGGSRLVGIPLEDTFFQYFSGRSRYGKALALDTPVPSPAGWTTMGELREGDEVFDERGQPCRVAAVTPVMYDHDCFEVVFSDGQTIVADAEHRWLTQDFAARRTPAERSRPTRARPRTSTHLGVSWSKQARKWIVQVAPRGYLGYYDDEGEASRVAAAALRCRPARAVGDHARVVTTREIAATLRTPNGHTNHAISTCEPLQYPAARLLVDPYLLGAWLGDGNAVNAGLTCVDVEILDKIRAVGHAVTRWCPADDSRAPTWGIAGLQDRLRILGLIGAKRIPGEYQRASVKQRLELLRGLMDTDGSVAAANGQCEFSVTNEPLARDVLELLLGLGVKAVWGVGRARIDGRDLGARYRITFTPTFAVFSLPRKVNKQRLDRQHPSRRRRYIVDVKPIASVPVRCISVDSPSHLYLAGRGCIPTHNTELGLNQFLHLVRSGHGAMFVDPHEDAITRMKTYLTDAEFADRILEINLAGMGDRPQIGWNPLAMAGLGPEHKPAKVRALEDSFAAALHWDQRNTRALNLVTQSAQTLIELAMILPPELAPTIFQITTLLSDEDWRGAVLPFISKTSQSFWTQRFDRLPKDAITPVTNLLDRLRPSPAIAALLGSSDSTYDVRRAMDEGKIVLACPGSGDASDELIANFLVYDLIRAAKTRVDTPPDRRRPFFLFLDELQIYDGAMSGNIAAILEQTAKYGLRAFAFNQDPNRLTDRTLNALLNNRSHLLTTVVSAAGAARLAKEWGGEPTATTITRLQRFTFLAHVTQGLDRPAPFLVQGVAAEEMWADHHHPERVPALDEHITLNTRRRRPTEIAKHLDDLDDRILAALHELSRGRRPGRPAAPPATTTSVRTGAAPAANQPSHPRRPRRRGSPSADGYARAGPTARRSDDQAPATPRHRRRPGHDRRRHRRRRRRRCQTGNLAGGQTRGWPRRHRIADRRRGRRSAASCRAVAARARRGGPPARSG